MIQKLIAFALFLLGCFMLIEQSSLWGIVPLILGVGLYKGSNRGVWISFEFDGGSDSSGSGDGGGGD